MTLHILSVVTVLMLLPWLAWADVAPAAHKQGRNGCQSYVLCDAEGDTGDCMSGGDEIVLDNLGGSRSRHTIFAHRSAATTFSCDIIASDMGHDEGGGAGVDVTATSITQGAPSHTLEGLGALFLWANCSTISGGGATVTMTINSCPAER